MKKACLSMFQHLLIYFILRSEFPPVEAGFLLKCSVPGLPKPPFIAIFQISTSQLFPHTGIMECYMLKVLSLMLFYGLSKDFQSTGKSRKDGLCVLPPPHKRPGYLRTLPEVCLSNCVTFVLAIRVERQVLVQ